jgi:hypothetical protein
MPCYQAKSSWTTLSSNELDDLRLHKDFLLYANAGVSLNIISFRKPTCIYCSDASEFGLGGYNVLTGEAWRWETPIELRLRTSINSLEFMACIITIWVDVSSSMWYAPDNIDTMLSCQFFIRFKH